MNKVEYTYAGDAVRHGEEGVNKMDELWGTLFLWFCVLVLVATVLYLTWTTWNFFVYEHALFENGLWGWGIYD